MSTRIKPVTLLVVGVVLAGTFLRLYRLPQTVMFQGDQGRDAIVVKHLIKDFDPSLIGPVTSVGNMYLGPFYYYFMAPWLALTYPNPIGPAYGIALMSILTLPLIFLMGRQMVGQRAALIALGIMALMDPVILAGRFSWNPNPAPLVSLLIIWSLYKVIGDHKPKYLILTAVSFGILTQLHYLALIMGAVIAGLVIYSFVTDKNHRRGLLIYSGAAIAVYLISWLPLAVFDISHKGIIHQGFINFFLSPEEHIQPLTKLAVTLKGMEGRGLQLLSQMLGGPVYWFDRLLVYGSILYLGFLFLTKKINLKREAGLLIVLVTIISTVILTAFYSETVFDHYLLYATPAVALYWGYLAAKGWQENLFGKVIVVLLLTLFAGYNLVHATTFAPAAPSIALFKMVTDTIRPHLKTGPYNLVLLSESKDYKGMNYRYFFETANHPPQAPDNYQGLKQLVIIDELKVMDPLTIHLYEIQEPGLKKLVNTFTLPNGPTVYIYE